METQVYSPSTFQDGYKMGVKEARYKTRYGKYIVLDRISDTHFFLDRAWDVLKKRQMHKYTHIKMWKLVPKSWEDPREYITRFKRRDRRNRLATTLMKMLLRDMMHDMMYNGNRLIFPCNWKGQTFGWYKIGFFNEYHPYKRKDRLIMAIVPHEREPIDTWYPVISCPIKTWGFMERHSKTTTVTHDDIDVQERLAAHQRLNGFGRRISSPAKTKAYNI